MRFGYGQQHPQRRSGGFPMRMIIGVVIAIAALVSYYGKTQKNEVTGENQRVAWGPEQEMALGLKAAPDMARQMGGAVDPARDPSAARVAEIGRRLAYETQASRSAYAKKNNFNFYLLNDSKMINAFALPGGQIFITRALYDKMDNEAQLAGVLGHEVGHVIHKHGAEHMAKGQLGQMLVTAVGVGASDEGGRGQMAAMATAMANNMLQLKYGRDDELESDAYGMSIMVELGYDPSEMLQVMRILAEAGKGNRQAEMLQTHPHPESRVERINQILEKYKGDWSKRNLTKGRPLQ